MPEKTERGSGSHLLAGILIADLGLLLIPLAGWDALGMNLQTLTVEGVSLFFLSGLFLIFVEAGLSSATDQPAPINKGKYLGSFQLNGYYFEAYERDGDNSDKELRLVSLPSVGPAQEAAFIRYIVHEELIECLLPKIGRQIEEEARWAFSTQ